MDDWCDRFALECSAQLEADHAELVDNDGDVWPAAPPGTPLAELTNGTWDCNDTNADIHPGADDGQGDPGSCNGLDEDCDGVPDDEHFLFGPWYPDRDDDEDGDILGTPEYACAEQYVQSSDPTVLYWATTNMDCDDTESSAFGAYGGGSETCNGVDDDCDGEVDNNVSEGLSTAWAVDEDGDGYSGWDIVYACDQPAGTIAIDLATEQDCDDLDPAVHPGATEVCNGIDDDCNLLVDLNDGDLDTSTLLTMSLDQDGDGFGGSGGTLELCEEQGAWVANADDCDDTDPDRHPEAAEVCDGIDQDCDAQVDEGAIDAPSWYPDGDGDGWGDGSRPTRGCQAPAGTVDRGGDCDDSSALFHPFAAEDDCDDPNDYNCDGSTGRTDADGDGWAACEDCDDGLASVSPGQVEVCDALDLDEDCNGSADDADPGVDVATASHWFTDADADGFGDADEAGSLSCDAPVEGATLDASDCDDQDPAISPDATEICDNGTDDDCDGGAGHCALQSSEDLGAADLVVTGQASGDRQGHAVVFGDVDGDGEADLVTSSPYYYSDDRGRVYVFDDLDVLSGGLTTGAASVDVVGASTDDYLGWSLAAGADLDGDGYGDLLVGSPYTDVDSTNDGAAYLLMGPVSGSVGSDGADLAFSGEDGGDLFGWKVAFLGDVSGDGLGDLAIAAPYTSTCEGTVYLFSGATTVGSASDADATISGDCGDFAGTGLAQTSDLDGDGVDDLVFGAPSDATGWDSGSVHVFLGPVSGSLDADDDADALFEGSVYRDRNGVAVLSDADLDGDGSPDLVMGAPNNDDGGTDAGALSIFLSSESLSLSGEHGVADGDGYWVGVDASDQLGTSLARVPDIDGDGTDELLIGAPGIDDGASNGGGAHLLYGPGEGTGQIDDDGGPVLLGDATSGAAGGAVAATEDVDGNGLPELAIGAFQAGGSYKGEAYLLFVQGL